ncbi:glycosyltransferase family 58 protein [Phycomyces blakesleeanus]|uniref:Dol-P-Man:Man(5)GlcNAc(2)-PP-Dol alpha-1,3-mannosyltransferase n=2 Tax=Phycomyces blakesleeanus TaxID=4837 RepID=A0A162UT71_PHYB8|nr:glycosyltransferase family 58 protein [Phycomyces blakesleeanus NRRL 1555(-)]OAD77773.1 glycosyltransferase family 58 protein [Phycomyces blakesleeanus NRRL 1555(-)]|eukprot:XP_018295813.1 glycosyltransferase family 58 protein [Phycomyces blakesleeanus NRRL 1555(-)]
MAQSVKRKRPRQSTINSNDSKVIKLEDIGKFLTNVLMDPSYIWYIATILLLGELVLNIVIIQKVAYTEIDWTAYMQEVKGFIEGERDYLNLRGDTGPLVYPAGFVYIYSGLYYLTNKGTNVRLAQYIFAGLYLATQAVVFALYSKSKKFPPYALALLCLSKRLHSIYALRCFNDPVAMFFMYSCILAMIHKRWVFSGILYSLAISVKMNVLLFFPAFGILLWQAIGAWRTFAVLSLMGSIQIVLGYPFLSTYPESYLGRAFEFSRSFDYQWTVNWRMVTEKTFGSGVFAKSLLAGHAIVLFLFLYFVWCKRGGGLVKVFLDGFKGNSVRRSVSPDDILSMMFTSNLIGMVFARSLHYQFYSWYYHALPYLLWQSVWMTTGSQTFRNYIRIFVLATIEACWMTFPSTERSSWTLFACHAILLTGLFKRDQEETEQSKNE